ncbi:MAG: alpha/beta fold hydrolase [Chloroflexi bacterium]|nr:alpha/beta fold hydrolase [Chloroflexota bacterium]OJV95121.1 MAG: hypothetical protein BGO39_24200 [Chloroflexi bacterium 54-19]
MTKSIVFIHGAWLTSLSWENFMDYFQKRGYEVSAPEWPYRDRPVRELREDTAPELAEIGGNELTDHFEKIIRAMDEPPILVGHSFGGLIVQRLLDRGVGRAGICLDSVAPEGIVGVDWTVLKANSSVLFKWMGWEKVQHMTLDQFRYAFANTMPEARQEEYYDRYVVPETGRIFFQIAFAQLDPHHATQVNFKNNDRAPLLLVAGEKDHLVPAHVTRANYDHYKHSTALTEFVEFKDRCHLLFAQDGWDEICTFAADWLEKINLGAQETSEAPAV